MTECSKNRDLHHPVVWEKLSIIFVLQATLQLTELRFYIPLDIKVGHFGDVLPSHSLGDVYWRERGATLL